MSDEISLDERETEVGGKCDERTITASHTVSGLWNFSEIYIWNLQSESKIMFLKYF